MEETETLSSTISGQYSEMAGVYKVHDIDGNSNIPDVSDDIVDSANVSFSDNVDVMHSTVDISSVQTDNCPQCDVLDGEIDHDHIQQSLQCHADELEYENDLCSYRPMHYNERGTYLQKQQLDGDIELDSSLFSPRLSPPPLSIVTNLDIAQNNSISHTPLLRLRSSNTSLSQLSFNSSCPSPLLSLPPPPPPTPTHHTITMDMKSPTDMPIPICEQSSDNFKLNDTIEREVSNHDLIDLPHQICLDVTSSIATSPAILLLQDQGQISSINTYYSSLSTEYTPTPSYPSSASSNSPKLPTCILPSTMIHESNYDVLNLSLTPIDISKSSCQSGPIFDFSVPASQSTSSFHVTTEQTPSSQQMPPEAGPSHTVNKKQSIKSLPTIALTLPSLIHEPIATSNMSLTSADALAELLTQNHISTPHTPNSNNLNDTINSSGSKKIVSGSSVTVTDESGMCL